MKGALQAQKLNFTAFTSKKASQRWIHPKRACKTDALNRITNSQWETELTSGPNSHVIWLVPSFPIIITAWGLIATRNLPQESEIRVQGLDGYISFLALL